MILYIDPGTGSMLFTILIGVLGAGFYFFRNLLVKMKYVLSGGRTAKTEDEKLQYVIFSDHKRYWNIFEPICDEFEKRQVKLVYMTESEDDPALAKEYKYIEARYIGEGNMAFAKLNVLNAHVVISTTPSLDVFQWKRSKKVDYYIHITHMPNDVTTYRMFGLDFYDAVLVSGQYQVDQIRKLEELRGLPAKDIEIVGLPYMDVMKARLDKDVNKIGEAEFGKDSLKGEEEDLGSKSNEMRTVLLAPSWGASGILSKYGERFIDALIDTGYKIIVRPHPQSYTSEKEMIDRLMAKYDDPSKVEWNRDNDNYEVLKKSDILISDFSGVIFDFALVFDKPVICADTSFDKAPYDAAWLDEELWTYEVLPKLGMKLGEDSIENIKSIIDECIEDTKYQKGRDEARQETWQHIGEGATRTVDFILSKAE